jgi:hypothetical protein
MKSCASFLSLLLTLIGCPAWAGDGVVTGPDRRQEIDARIEALDARRAEISTSGPKTATLVGLVVTVTGGALFGASSVPCRNNAYGCEDLGFDPALLGIGFGLLVIGGAMTVTGGTIWGVRAHRRNEIDAERESLIEERDALPAALSRLQLNSTYRDDTHFVTLGVRF